MRRELFLAVAILAVLLLACGVGQATAPVQLDPGTIETRVAEEAAATLTAVGLVAEAGGEDLDPSPVPPTLTEPPPAPNPTLTPPPTLTPVPPAPTPTLAPPPTVTPVVQADSVALPLETPVSDVIPGAGYTLADETLVGDYVIRLWHSDPEADPFFHNTVLVIHAPGQAPVQIEMVSAVGSFRPSGSFEWLWQADIRLDMVARTDITGNGYPDLVVQTFSGGAHCCFSTIVYELGPNLARLMHTVEGNCGGDFEDLDGDGRMEFVTCDDSFAYRYCCFAGSPAVKVILKYTPDQGYLPDSPRFRPEYENDIAYHTQMAETGDSDDFCEEDGTPKCQVLPVVLDYLYTGRPDEAEQELRRLYNAPDVDQFWGEILDTVSRSPYFVFP